MDGIKVIEDLNLIRLGAILELVHLATLVHDDILDEASIRHGSPTVAVKYGKDAAVLVGDVLFAHALSYWHRIMIRQMSAALWHEQRVVSALARLPKLTQRLN